MKSPSVFAIGCLMCFIIVQVDCDYHKKCAKKFGLNVNEVAGLIYFPHLTEDNPRRWYTSCLIEKGGYIVDGVLDTDRIIKEISSIDDKKKIYKFCALDKHLPPIDVTVKLLECLYLLENMPKHKRQSRP